VSMGLYKTGESGARSKAEAQDKSQVAANGKTGTECHDAGRPDIAAVKGRLRHNHLVIASIASIISIASAAFILPCLPTADNNLEIGSTGIFRQRDKFISQCTM
jgi:hypothetical protein